MLHTYLSEKLKMMCQTLNKIADVSIYFFEIAVFPDI